jgi:hypothetical protein
MRFTVLLFIAGVSALRLKANSCAVDTGTDANGAYNPAAGGGNAYDDQDAGGGNTYDDQDASGAYDPANPDAEVPRDQAAEPGPKEIFAICDANADAKLTKKELRRCILKYYRGQMKKQFAQFKA